MAKYTIELRALNNPPFFKLFDFEYDFYEESKKEQFEQKFIDYFYMREIDRIDHFQRNLLLCLFCCTTT